jgi:hypothetical protein
MQVMYKKQQQQSVRAQVGASEPGVLALYLLAPDPPPVPLL